MSAGTPDPRLEALLRDLPAPPPVPAGLAGRVLAAAAATPQEAQPARARRAAARRDRRGGWLRRPLLAGTAALGLVVTSAVAATLAGVPIPQKIAAVFFPEKAPEPKQAAAPARPARPAPVPSVPARTAEAAPAGDAAWLDQPGPIRRLMIVERRVAARRAMGLPTPRADRLERQLRRRAEMWRDATPEQRSEWQARQRDRQAARQAALATPEGQAMQAQLRRWRAQREAGVPLTPEQRAERQALIRAWRMQSGAGRPPLTDVQREARQARWRQWREARRARWQRRSDRPDAAPEAEAEGMPAPDR